MPELTTKKDSPDSDNTESRQLPALTDDARAVAVQSEWSINESNNLYGIDRWSNGYFGVAANGNLTVTAPGLEQHPVELLDVVEGLKQRGLEMPVMLRIENLLADRVEQLNVTFNKAITESDYRGQFCGVYPIKVNQQSHVVSEITRIGEPFAHGLEAGSKAELLIAMSTRRSRDSLIVCNGYKDEEFIDLGLQATRIGFKCFFVLETPVELRLILRRPSFGRSNLSSACG